MLHFWNKIKHLATRFVWLGEGEVELEFNGGRAAFEDIKS